MISRDPVRINLVEQEDWERYDPAAGKFDWTIDSAWQDFRALDIGSALVLIHDLWTSSPGKGKRRPRKILSSEELRYLAKKLLENDDVLEPVRRAIVDAGGLMYQMAATPDDADLKMAMERASQEFNDNPEMSDDLWDPFLLAREIGDGPKGWFPRHGRLVTLRELFEQISGAITFEREEDHWDRYLVFDFWSMPVMKDILKIHPELEWEFDAEFRNMRGNYRHEFFKALNKIMDSIEISNRTDWRKNWKSMISDGSVVWEAQEAIKKALQDMPEEPNEP